MFMPLTNLSHNSKTKVGGPKNGQNLDLKPILSSQNLKNAQNRPKTHRRIKTMDEKKFELNKFMQEIGSQNIENTEKVIHQ